MRALIIEDNKLAGFSISKHLEKLSFTPLLFDNGTAGVKAALADPPEVLFVDYRLPDLTGIEALQQLQTIREQTVMFLMTAFGSRDIAVEALKLGAYEYLNKPIDFEEVSVLVQRALTERKIARERDELKDREQRSWRIGSFVSRSQKMQEVIETVRKIVQVETGTVLLLGETGTGKDTLARLIHEQSARSDKPFTVTNCASLQSTLLESELFGHESGAFTDAKTRKLGQLEVADGGTVYMDEIGEVPVNFQAKFLRFVETRSFYRVGGTRELKVDVRLIASTNRDLREEMEKGNFREDLFFRLNVISVTIPPLRERKEDIPLLTRHLIDRLGSELHVQVEGISPEAFDMMCEYDWPGNVRQLKNTIERIILLDRPNIIETRHFPAEVRNPGLNKATDGGGGRSWESLFEGKSLQEVEIEMLRWALTQEEGNQSRAAARMKISRDQIRYQMKKYNLL